MKPLFKSIFRHLAMYLLGMALIFGCSLPEADPDDDGDGDKNPPQNPLAPTNLTVKRDGYSNSLIVSWNAVGGGVLYELFRIAGGGPEEQLRKSADTAYYDDNYPLEERISYKVRSAKDGLYSAFTPLSVPLTVPIPELPVRNVKAGALEYEDRIRISWDPITQVGVTPFYIVQRFRSKVNTEPDAEFLTQGDFKQDLDGCLYFEDTQGGPSPAPDSQTPYYYRILWSDGLAGEQGKESQFAFGIYSSEDDDHNYEPNDDQVKTKRTINGLPSGITFVSFRYEDGGVVNEDVDWYKYENPPDMLGFRAWLTGSKTTIKQLCFEFYYRGEKQAGLAVSTDPYTYIFLKDTFENPTSSDEDLYIKIFPDEDSGKGIGSYCLDIQ